MIAQKLNNNKIAIGNSAPRKDAIEIIYDLKASEFCRLFKAAREWSESLNDNRDIVFAHYENEHSKICKEFDKMIARRKAFKEKYAKYGEDNFLVDPVVINEKSTKPYITTTHGTARLIYLKNRDSIIMIKRNSSRDRNVNKENSVCISNELREQFFADAKTTRKHKKDHFEIRRSDSSELFNKWLDIIRKTFENRH